LCFVVVGVTGTKGQETERFLGAGKPARLLVGWEDSIVSLWASGKRMLGSIFLLLTNYIANGHLQQLGRRYFTWYFVVLMF
jgi:hypothetical protein